MYGRFLSVEVAFLPFGTDVLKELLIVLSIAGIQVVLVLGKSLCNVAHQLGCISIVADAHVTFVGRKVCKPVAILRVGTVIEIAIACFCSAPLHVFLHGSVVVTQYFLVASHEIDIIWHD